MRVDGYRSTAVLASMIDLTDRLLDLLGPWWPSDGTTPLDALSAAPENVAVEAYEVARRFTALGPLPEIVALVEAADSGGTREP